MIIGSNKTIFLLQENDQWLVDGLAMRKLSDTTNRLLYLRWRSRLLLSLVRDIKFMSALRYDYATDYFFYFFLVNAIFATLMVGGQVPPQPPV